MALVLSLFPGLGVLDMGFEAAGFTVVRGPDPLWGGDVRRFHPPTGVFDGVIGGPPCQTFSALAQLVRHNGYEPSFGNLIPEFVRCVAEARPAWWLMENVPRVPEEHWPTVEGYGVSTFVVDLSALDRGDGIGHQQMRKRRFWFGTRDRTPPNLAAMLPFATLELPMATRQPAVTSPREKYPVKIGGSGKVTSVFSHAVGVGPGTKGKTPAVTGAHTCSHRPKGGHGENYSVADMLRLQGLPADLFEHSPFTVAAQRKLIGNAVPRPMAEAIARAVMETTE